ncbi:MAG: AI-2E family transporter, partial [Roseobacter sp.]
MKAEARDLLERVLPISAIAIVFMLGALALSPFAPALLWAVFVSVALHPLHVGLCGRFGGRRGLATATVVVGLIFFVLIPMLLLWRSVIAVLPELAIILVEGGNLEKIGLDLPANMPPTWVDLWNGLRDNFEEVRRLVGDDLRLFLSTLMFEGRLIGHFVLEFMLGLILAGVILQNADSLKRLSSKAFQKLGGARGLTLASRSVLTIRYTVLGILGSAAVQTAIAAFAYLIVGVPHWPLLAFATFMLGLLQVGPVLIWGPLALWLWLDGQTGMAIFLALWGLFVVGLSDNAVKAIVVARGANLPTTLVFLGALGGLLIWGVVGIFLGPVILALCLELILWWL